MRRRVLVLSVLMLMVGATMLAFASLASAQPACCQGIQKVAVASKNKQGPPHNPKAHCATALVAAMWLRPFGSEASSVQASVAGS